MAVQKSSDRLNWDDLRYFSVLADTGRVSAAAIKLGVNHVTVSRRIERLEESLNRKLFARTNDGYSLTPDGDLLQSNLEQITPVLEKISDSADKSGGIKKTVKISMVHSMAETLVLPALRQLQNEHPNLTLEFDTSSSNVNIVKRESDIALRLALPEKGDYLSRRLSNLDYVLCATEELARRCEDGQSVPTINYTQSPSILPEAEYMFTRFGIDNIALQTNSATVQRSAAISGVGIAILPQYLFRNSGLSKIKMHEPVQREIWLLTRKNTSQLGEIRLVINALAVFCQEQKDLLQAN